MVLPCVSLFEIFVFKACALEEGQGAYMSAAESLLPIQNAFSYQLIFRAVSRARNSSYVTYRRKSQ